MINTDDHSLCSGCGACALICPKTCISFSTDVLGSSYAVIDAAACIGCGKCETVCPMQKEFNQPQIGIKAYAAYSIDDGIRFRGSSGGLFEAIADWILSRNGVVYASRFDENLKLKMFEASTKDEVKKLTKSKYLQSDVAGSFTAIKNSVRKGIHVLVCSTPCQVAALKNYLGKDAEADNLYLMDFFCHGVPSQRLFDNCIEYMQKREGIKVISYEFRSKKKRGVTPHYYTIKYTKAGNNKQRTRLYLRDPFYLGFQKYITLRDSCYHCPYGSGNHAGDITVGDFHNIDRYVKGINRFDGVSTVITNNDKGNRVWDSICNHLEAHELDLQQLYSDHQVYSGCTPEPLLRSVFIKDAAELPFEVLMKKWFYPRKEWKKTLYYFMPVFIRRGMKSIMGL